MVGRLGWYAFYVRFALPTTLWLFCCTTFCCCFVNIFPYERAIVGFLLCWVRCVRIPQLLYNWMKSIIQSEAFIHFFLSVVARNKSNKYTALKTAFVSYRLCVSYARIHKTMGAKRTQDTKNRKWLDGRIDRHIRSDGFDLCAYACARAWVYVWTIVC